MTTLKEGNLQIRFPRGTNVKKFDDSTHGLSHCMKAVDFVVELTDRICFIEIKDPDNPQAQPPDKQEFARKLLAEELDADLIHKFRDSFLYEWACDRFGKPIHYWVVIGLDSLTDAELLNRKDALERKLPAYGPSSGKWKRNLVKSCLIFTMQTWNRHFPQFPMSRMNS